MLPIDGRPASSNDLRYNTPAYRSFQQGYRLRDVLKNYLDVEINYLNPRRNRSYISKRKLIEFWEAVADERTRTLSFVNARYRNQLSQLFLKDNFRSLQRVACTLIWTNEDILVEVLTRLTNSSHATLTDVHPLPWDNSRVRHYIDEVHANQFFQDQYIFVEPIDIGIPRSSSWRYGERIPIPLVGRFTLAHAGLCKVRIHRSHLYSGATQAQGSNHEAPHELNLSNTVSSATELACSVLPRECDIDDHLRHNSDFSRSLRSHANIATLIDVINRGDEIYIFLPCPELGDLESLLSVPLLNNAFCDPVDDVLCNLAMAFEGVVSGLEHLIETALPDVHIEISFTPRNIVRYFEAGSPFGRWKLLDFRIVQDPRLHRAEHTPEDIVDNPTNLDMNEYNNLVDQQTHPLPTNLIPAIGNNYGNVEVNGSGSLIQGTVYNFNSYNLSLGTQSALTNGSRTRLYPEDAAFMGLSRDILQTPYVAPELAAGSYTFDLRTSIWSLGCILLELIAHSQSRSHVTTGATSTIACCRDLRDQLDHGPFFELDRNSASQHQATVGARLNQHVVQWLETLPTDSIYGRCAKIALQTLSFHPEQRPDARGLRRLFRSLQCNIDFVHSSDASTDGTMEQLSEASAHDDDVVVSSTRLSYLPVTLLRPSITSDLDACQSFVNDRWQLIISQDCVLLCRKVPRSPTDEFWVRPVDSSLIDKPDEAYYLLPAGVKWQDLQLNGRYGTVSSIEATVNGDTAELQYYLFDIMEKQRHRFPEPILIRGELQMIIPARNGLVAFCSSSMIYLRPVFGSVADTIDPFSAATTRSSSQILQTVFNHDGTQLFVYVTQETEHYIQVWNVSPSQHATRVANANVGLNGGRSPQHINLLPSDALDSCIILHDQCLKFGVAQRGGQPGSIDTTGFLEDQLTARRVCLTAVTRCEYLLLMTSTRSRHTVRLFKMDRMTHPPSLISVGHDTLHIEGSSKIVWAMVRYNEVGPQSDATSMFEVLIRDSKGKDHSFELDPREEPIRSRPTQAAHPLHQVTSATSSNSGSWLSRRLVLGRRRS